MDKIIIRKASVDDIPMLLELLYELGRPRPENDLDIDTFEKLLKSYCEDSDKEIFIAEYDAKIIGMVSMMLLSRLNQVNHEMYFPELIVTEKFQNQGIGKKLTNECIKFAKEKKCHRMRLESGIQRKESHLFYKKIGFEQSALSFTKNLEQ